MSIICLYKQKLSKISLKISENPVLHSGYYNIKKELNTGEKIIFLNFFSEFSQDQHSFILYADLNGISQC